MVTHTRIIDTKTGHPYPEISPRFMENWKWSGGRSVDEIADYMSYGLNILKNIGLPCEGLTTPGGFGSDARVEAQVVSLFEHIEREIGPIEVLVFNIGGNVNFPIAETTERVFRKVWEMSCLSGFLNAREAAKVMQARGRGTILFTGATASLRGGSGFSAFAAGKHGLRAVAQSMARELGAKNIHVAHVVIDGGIDTAFIQERNPERYATLKPQDGILNPEAIAENYWHLHCQHRSAWTHELDLRPWMERW
jgi:NAD(P)-dependent dehydrogenase (short-subunit alcohol dehydrogenase family)